MISLRQILTYIIKSINIPLETGNLTATATTGTFISGSYVKWGPIIEVNVKFRNTNSVAAGSIEYQGVITEPMSNFFPQHRNPLNAIFFGNNTLVGALNGDGQLTIRNTGPDALAMGSTSSSQLTLFYIRDWEVNL